MKIAVILPSRGLMFSRTADEILRNLRGFNYKFYFSHRKPIPECFEDPTREALKDESTTHIWFVEDDMIIPDNTLWDMYAMDKEVVTCDYPVTKKGKGAVFSVDNEVVFCGTGCLLIKREVFDKLKSPYFRSDIRWTPLNYGKTVKLVASINEKDGYGLHDVTFGIKLYKAGIPIHVFSTIGQRKLIELGKAGSNKGAHKIQDWLRVKPDYQLKKILKYPLALSAKGELVTVDTPTGGIRVTRKHAESLIDQGLAQPINEKKVIIDDSGVEI